jgi:8-oxo-dGTP pyrophosphatase MutT (NUDIX family)
MGEGTRADYWQSSGRRAAVAIVRTIEADPVYLLLRRVVHAADPWSGHYAFPGGGWEPSDQTLLDTCMRETFEECGITLQLSQLRMQLPPRVAGALSGSAVSVTPFVFELPLRPPLTLQPQEIASAHWLPHSRVCSPSAHTQRPLLPHAPEREFRCLSLDDYYIWGFTYELLRDVALQEGWGTV